MLKRFLCIVMAVLIFSLTGCQQWEGKRGEEVYYGTAEMEQIHISAEAAGVLQEVKVAAGQEVHKGDVIAVISAPENSIKADQAQLGIESANNALQQLIDKGASDVAQDAAELGVKQAEKNYELSKLAVNKSEVKTMVDGVVDTLNYSTGEYVTPGSPVVTLSDPTDIWVKIYVPEKALAGMTQNQEVQLKSDFVSDEIKGFIANISSKAEYTPMNIVTKNEREKLVYAVKIQITEHRDQIKPGMLLDVYLK